METSPLKMQALHQYDYEKSMFMEDSYKELY